MIAIHTSATVAPVFGGTDEGRYIDTITDGEDVIATSPVRAGGDERLAKLVLAAHYAGAMEKFARCVAHADWLDHPQMERIASIAAQARLDGDMSTFSHRVDDLAVDMRVQS